MNARGFTLAETLISLMILAVISVYTIPKLLVGTTDSRKKTMAKEMAGVITDAYTKHVNAGLRRINTVPIDLRQYMNYVRVDTIQIIDDVNGYGSISCGDTGIVDGCVVLHNGGVLAYEMTSFAAATSNNAIWFIFDPDGKYNGSTSGSGKSVIFALYYNGLITSNSYIKAATCDSFSCYGPGNYDPVWFNWN